MRFLALALLVLPACGGLFAPEPEEGDYEVEVSDVDFSDACTELWGLEPSDDDSFDIEVEVSDDEIEFVDSFECDRDGAAFGCEQDLEEPVDGYDATLFNRSELVGEWTSSTTFTADLETVLSCEGDDCDVFSTDCEMSATWEGELDE